MILLIFVSNCFVENLEADNPTYSKVAGICTCNSGRTYCPQSNRTGIKPLRKIMACPGSPGDGTIFVSFSAVGLKVS